MVSLPGILVSIDARLPNRLIEEAVVGGRLEARSVILVWEGMGYFPDAVTSRGRRHLEELVNAKVQGERAAVVFVVQRPDAHSLSPHDESDPEFGAVLREAVASGVEAYAYSCWVGREEVALKQKIPVLL
jgi:sugar fermentation stimulation protein A